MVTHTHTAPSADMQHLGFCGVIKLSTLIVLNNLNHFLRIALFFALPYALHLITLGPCFKSLHTLLAFISLLYKLGVSEDPLHSSDITTHDAAIFGRKQEESNPLCLLLFLFIFYIIILSLICSPLVAFGVCRACIHRSLSLKGSLRGVCRSAANLVLTVLCMAAAFAAFCAVAMSGMVIMAAVLPVNLTIPMRIWTIGVVYMAVALSLADAVAILEEKKGWEAMRRSAYLMKGSKEMAMELYSVYGVVGMVPLVVCASEEGGGVVWRWSAGGVRVGVQACIALCSMAARIVVYMSCKSLHEEPLDTLVAASSQFGPLDHSARYLDLESAATTL